MRPEIWLIIAATVALWAALCGLLWHRFVVPVCCWPLVGSCWRHRRRGYCARCGLDGGRHFALHAESTDLPGPGRDSSPLGDDGLVNQLGSTPNRATGTWAGEPDSDEISEGTWVKQFSNGIETAWVRTDDDEWADQLHEINQLGKFGDLTRPVACQTHYEVEYLIRQLGVAEWVPERWRAAE